MLDYSNWHPSHWFKVYPGCIHPLLYRGEAYFLCGNSIVFVCVCCMHIICEFGANAFALNVIITRCRQAPYGNPIRLFTYWLLECHSGVNILEVIAHSMSIRPKHLSAVSL